MWSRRSCRSATAALLPLPALLAAATAAAALPCERCVIREDTTWQGEVLVTGAAVVKKGATLTILPGTRVRFARVDEDGDGIGDGELNVEGRIVARGEPGREISFASAAPEPRPKDWTFLMISTSRGSVLEHCRFEHAFTGVQVHYSTATVRSCVFTGNFEGMRFSTADVLIEGNEFHGNGTGIRYESNGSPTVIRCNVFADNGYAFYPAARSGSTVHIERNSITGSTEYQVALGQTQREDLDFRNNWWGTTDPAAVAAGIFDRERDPALGRVLWEPGLTGAPEGCRWPQGTERTGADDRACDD